MANVTVTGKDLESLGPQFQWHRKPSGWSGAPCPICGCTTKRLRAEHRAVAFGEGRPGPWIKRVSACFGLDFSVETLKG